MWISLSLSFWEGQSTRAKLCQLLFLTEGWQCQLSGWRCWLTSASSAHWCVQPPGAAEWSEGKETGELQGTVRIKLP